MSIVIYMILSFFIVLSIILIIQRIEMKEELYAEKRMFEAVKELNFKLINKMTEYKEDFFRSQDKLASVQTAFMEYKKGKGEYDEKNFEVFL